jgi:hypothetical protein
MDGAVNPAAAQQCVVGGIDYGIDVQRCDICLNYFYRSFHVFLISGF